LKFLFLAERTSTNDTKSTNGKTVRVPVLRPNNSVVWFVEVIPCFPPKIRYTDGIIKQRSHDKENTMSDLPQKSSDELAAELLNLMPKLKSTTAGWRFFVHEFQAGMTAKHLLLVAQLILAQQQEIEQLKAELKELKQR